MNKNKNVKGIDIDDEDKKKIRFIGKFKKIVNKFDKDTKFFIINLFFTLVIGIYSTIIVNKQDQKFQIELAQYQEKLAIDNSFTELGINVNYGTSFIYTCFPFISIQNNGNINANNVKIFVELKSINPDWDTYVDDVSQFRVVAFNNPLFQIEKSKKDYYSNLNSDIDNLLIISIDHLKPNEKFLFYIIPKFDDSMETGERSEDLEIILKTDYQKFGEFLHDFFWLANFSIDMSCDNCRVKDNFESLDIKVSNLNGCNFSVKEREEYTDGSERIVGNLFYYYFIPDGNFLNYSELPEMIEINN